MRDDDDEAGLPPLGYDETRVRAWLAARLGRPPTTAEVRSVWARMCVAWARRARRVRSRVRDTTDADVARLVRDDVLREMAGSLEARLLLTVAYAVLQIGRGQFISNCQRLFAGRAQSAEWRRRRDERAGLLSYLGVKLGMAAYEGDSGYGLPPALVAPLNVGTARAATGWRDRIAAAGASSGAYARAVRELRADGAEAAEAFPGFVRPEPGPPRGLWLSSSERSALPPEAPAEGASVPSPCASPAPVPAS